jgi:hypothetical protein
MPLPTTPMPPVTLMLTGGSVTNAARGTSLVIDVPQSLSLPNGGWGAARVTGTLQCIAGKPSSFAVAYIGNIPVVVGAGGATTFATASGPASTVTASATAPSVIFENDIVGFSNPNWDNNLVYAAYAGTAATNVLIYIEAFCGNDDTTGCTAILTDCTLEVFEAVWDYEIEQIGGAEFVPGCGQTIYVPGQPSPPPIPPHYFPYLTGINPSNLEHRDGRYHRVFGDGLGNILYSRADATVPLPWAIYGKPVAFGFAPRLYIDGLQRVWLVCTNEENNTQLFLSADDGATFAEGVNYSMPYAPDVLIRGTLYPAIAGDSGDNVVVAATSLTQLYGDYETIQAVYQYCALPTPTAPYAVGDVYGNPLPGALDTLGLVAGKDGSALWYLHMLEAGASETSWYLSASMPPLSSCQYGGSGIPGGVRPVMLGDKSGNLLIAALVKSDTYGGYTIQGRVRGGDSGNPAFGAVFTFTDALGNPLISTFDTFYVSAAFEEPDRWALVYVDAVAGIIDLVSSDFGKTWLNPLDSGYGYAG